MSLHLSNLTSKQKKVYTVIENYIKTHGIPPTVREIGEMVGEKTPGAVQGILNRLEQKGVIKRQVGMARSIQLVSEDNTMYASPVFVPEIKKISKRNLEDLFSIYNITKYHPVTPEILSPEREYFIYKCPDGSIEDRGIAEGDSLLASISSEPEEGSLVIALYENHVLVREYRKSEDNSSIILNGDNTFISKDTFDPQEIKLVGKVEGIYKKI